MKLWLIKHNRYDKIWENPWYDKAQGFVVRAETETQARAIAVSNKGDEDKEGWHNPTHSSCIELLPKGEAGLILEDFAAA